MSTGSRSFQYFTNTCPNLEFNDKEIYEDAVTMGLQISEVTCCAGHCAKYRMHLIRTRREDLIDD